MQSSRPVILQGKKLQPRDANDSPEPGSQGWELAWPPASDWQWPPSCASQVAFTRQKPWFTPPLLFTCGPLPPPHLFDL